MSRTKPTFRLCLEELEARTLLSVFTVAPTVADSAAGSAAAPWQTLQQAANMVKPGDTVLVQSGSYQGFDLTTSGTPANPISFMAQPGVTIGSPNTTTGRDGINLEGASYVVIDGFTINGMPRAGIRAVTDNHVTIRNNTTDRNGYWGIFTGFSDYVDIENNTTSNSAIEHGIYVSNSAVSPIIRNNISYGNARNGIHLNGDASEGGSGVITGALVVGNIIHDNGATGGSGINGDGVQNSTIENNLLYNNHASGISLYQINAADGSKNNLIANNTIIMAVDARWALNIQNASTGNTVLNNVLYDYNTGHGSIDISSDSLSGFTSDYNVVMNGFTTDDGSSIQNLGQWQSSTGQDTHSLVATPTQLFVNPGASDYRLQAGSPGIDRGTTRLSPTTDLTGAPRPSGSGNDIGAYEYQQALPPTSQPSPNPPSTPGLPPAQSSPGTAASAAPSGVGSSNGPILVTGADAGGGPDVKVFDAATGALKFEFFAYDPRFTGGVRVAVGDVNGDGVPDIITAPGPGGGPDIHVYDGRIGSLFERFFAFAPAFIGGSYVAAGDVNSDGHADIIIGADQGGGPDVSVYSGVNGSQLMSFFAYDPRFTGGVRVAAGDVDGDGRVEIITGAGPGGGPDVSIFRGSDGVRLRSFFAFEPRLAGGIFVAADVTGHGHAAIVAGSGTSSAVAVLDGSTGALLESLQAADPAFSGGVRPAAADRNGDGRADIITTTGPGGAPDIHSTDGVTLQQIDDFFAYSPLFRGGLFVAAG